MREMTMYDENLIRMIEADRRREEAAMRLARTMARARLVGQGADRSVVRSARRAVGHGLIDVGLRVAAVRPAPGRRIAAGLPK